MEEITNLWEKIEGKKTYFVVGFGIAYQIARYWGAEIDLATFIESVSILLGLGTIRHGVTTTVKK